MPVVAGRLVSDSVETQKIVQRRQPLPFSNQFKLLLIYPTFEPNGQIKTMLETEQSDSYFRDVSLAICCIFWSETLKKTGKEVKIISLLLICIDY